MAELRHTLPQDWKLLRSIRLEALDDSPDAFCTTHEEAAVLGDVVWIERSSADPMEGVSATFLAVEGEEAVGMAAGVLCDEHRLEVISVFVTPAARGTGVARDLMEMIEGWGRDRGAREAVLDVEADNRRAGAFYANLGYLPTGRRETYPGRSWLHRLELTKPLGGS